MTDKTPEAIVNEQAEDEGLWFEAKTAPEAYLQQELRRLHAAVEGKTPQECVADLDKTPEERAREHCKKTSYPVCEEVFITGYREGQANPSPAAVARVLREAIEAVRSCSTGIKNNIQQDVANHEASLKQAERAIEAMIPESERLVTFGNLLAAPRVEAW